MPDLPPPTGGRGRTPDPATGGDPWGPATAVRSASADLGTRGHGSAPARSGHPAPGTPSQTPRPPLTYRSPIPPSGRGARSRDTGDSGYGPDEHGSGGRRAGAVDVLPDEAHPVDERGLPGWAGLVVLLVIAGIGGLIDSASGAQVRGGFNIGIIVASVVAILVVRRSGMFPVVVAPPLVYAGASGAMLYLRSGGLNDRKVLFDAAANWLVYGFPAIAAATAAVLIIAGIRLVVRR